MRQIAMVLCVALFFAGSNVLAQGREPNAPPPQLTIDSVAVTDPTISIHGTNFGASPIVLLPGGSLSPLQIQQPSTNELIVGFLPPNLKPGTYVLIVSKGRGATDISAIDFTIGAQGPAGPPEPMVNRARTVKMERTARREKTESTESME